MKSSLDSWRSWTLILATAGASFSTLGEQLKKVANPKHDQWHSLIHAIAIAASLGGAAAIALASYFAREALSGERVENWTKARSAAEASKSALYLYRAAADPYNGEDRDKKLLERREVIETGLEGIELASSRAEMPDLSPLAVSDYITKRVDPQIKYYRDTAAGYQMRVARLRLIVFWLGVVGVLLGVGAAAGRLGSWVAVVGTVTAAVSSHIQSQRYQGLIVLYRATERRLRFLKEEWEASGKLEADKPARNSFIQSCEDAMALENGAWLAQWSQQKQAQGTNP
jgi:hypothetical protein